MSSFVTLIFDLSSARVEDYERIKDELAKAGLYDTIIGDSGKKIELPINTYCGEFDENNVDSIDLRNHLIDRAAQVFRNCRVKGKFFVSIGKGWTWGQRQV
jgi:hypothetical protein